MESIFVFTSVQSGARGHGEPAPQYLTLLTSGGGYYGIGKPAPAFTSREAAEAFQKEAKLSTSSWTITEIPIFQPVPKEPKGKWVFERSSGFAGYRCRECATWIHLNSRQYCVCDSI